MENKRMESAINEAREKYAEKRGGYNMSYRECMELVETFRNKPIKSTVMSFDYGFMKGVRFAKAMMKKGCGEKGARMGVHSEGGRKTNNRS